MNTLTVGKFISELRKEKGLTQKDLAKKLNITDKAVSKWETGRSAPDISMLISLSDILGVTVVEILQGERIKAEHFPTVSDKVVVQTMKSDKQKLKRSIIIVLILTLLIFSVSAISYPAYHFFTSAPVDNEIAILKQIYDDNFDEIKETAKIVKTVKKGNYLFYLIQSDNNISMCFFKTDELFDDRISYWGGSGCSNPNEISQYCCGEVNVTINVFFGYDMTDTEYRYSYRGVECTKPIEDKYVLDVFIDIDDSFTNANLIGDAS